MPARESKDSDNVELGEAIAAVERSLLALKERYAQVQEDREKRSQYQQRQQHLEEEDPQQPEIQAELQRLQQEIDALDLNLESRLFRWRSFQQPFWQAVRFGGLGVAIGWLLKSCAG